MTGEETASPTALARRLVREGRIAEAEGVIAALVAGAFGLEVREVGINADWTSLNSLNGRVTAGDGALYFFKFHQEEGEEGAVREYYRAEILQKAGLPVDMPLMVSRRPGHQVLLYGLRRDRSLAELCLGIEAEAAGGGPKVAGLAALQRELDRKTVQVYGETLHPADPERSAAEAIHQLFHHRLVTPPDTGRLGGRALRFYGGSHFDAGGTLLPWERLSGMHWRINGVTYRHTLAGLFAESLEVLRPLRLAQGGAVTAHGDAHNGNVWVEERDGARRLVLFDPAFAGDEVPALLAEVKATFHNIFAHPHWLYHPELAGARRRISARVEGETLVLDHDWALSPLREAFLASKIEEVWRPLLAELRRRGLLVPEWERILRCAMFCCPTLVLDLSPRPAQEGRAGRSDQVALLSLAIALMAGSPPAGDGEDPFTRFIAAIAP